MDIPRTHESFACRHIGPREEDIQEMLSALGLNSLDEMVERIVPETIRTGRPLRLPEPLSEHEALEAIRRLASQNRIHRSFIGMGYFGCITPPVIQRNVLENPGWYTQYTPYQAEIAQGRLEALLNFQTMVCDLTGMEIANASLLDEGTAAAEAMTLCHAVASRTERNRFFVARNCHPQTIEVIKTRAFNVGIEVVVRRLETLDELDSCFGALIQFPATDGQIEDYRRLVERIHAAGALVVVASDLLALTLLTPPGDWGADVVVGSAQRFGVPMGFGGPHAAFFATRDEYKRLLPGRIVGVSKEADGRPALRLALQTREQHIRRDKATSNICTAQVLLAVMASMYAVYHGPEGLRRIASSIHAKALLLAKGLRRLGYSIRHESFFDTLRVDTESSAAILRAAEAGRMNFRVFKDGSIGLSLDETTRETDLADILKVFAGKEFLDFSLDDLAAGLHMEFDTPLARRGAYLTHPVFNSYRSETEMLRYIQRLQARDLSLTTSMIPLGSCTMKLNATAEMLPITWPEWSQLHPFISLDQAKGYQALIRDLESMLSEIAGLARVSLQPNAGSQGEYSGLLTIRAYMRATGHGSRNVCLIPTSAHGTNPASAVMAGLSVVVIDCDDEGNIDLADLRAKAEKHKDELAALMVTYPSTHGVFEESIRDICEIVHDFGGQVYLDGANMNALVGLCRPGEFGVDVIHLNLHKTFCIPHGGGGPGVGPIAVAEHLAPYLPSHFHGNIGSDQTIGLIAAAPWGSAGILPISWMYMRMMGGPGLTEATKVSILNANYIAKRLEGHFPVLYTGRTGFVAHECILDCRQFKKSLGISVLDIAKRLMDYGFHAPTVSWPVVETMMVEPTESESKEELDRFCDALISIRNEIREIEAGLADPTNNVLKNAPHSLHRVMADSWDRPYSREKAAFPAPWLRTSKFWPSVGRIDDSYGDRHLFCSCVPIDAYAGVAE